MDILEFIGYIGIYIVAIVPLILVRSCTTALLEALNAIPINNDKIKYFILFINN